MHCKSFKQDGFELNLNMSNNTVDVYCPNYEVAYNIPIALIERLFDYINNKQ